MLEDSQLFRRGFCTTQWRCFSAQETSFADKGSSALEDCYLQPLYSWWWLQPCTRSKSKTLSILHDYVVFPLYTFQRCLQRIIQEQYHCACYLIILVLVRLVFVQFVKASKILCQERKAFSNCSKCNQ